MLPVRLPEAERFPVSTTLPTGAATAPFESTVTLPQSPPTAGPATVLRRHCPAYELETLLGTQVQFSWCVPLPQFGGVGHEFDAAGAHAETIAARQTAKAQFQP